MEEMFLYNAFDVGKEGAGKADFSIFVLYFDGNIKFHSREGWYYCILPFSSGSKDLSQCKSFIPLR